jgi:hypothetical protein
MNIGAYIGGNIGEKQTNPLYCDQFFSFFSMPIKRFWATITLRF